MIEWWWILPLIVGVLIVHVVISMIEWFAEQYCNNKVTTVLFEVTLFFWEWELVWFAVVSDAVETCCSENENRIQCTDDIIHINQIFYIWVWYRWYKWRYTVLWILFSFSVQHVSTTLLIKAEIVESYSIRGVLFDPLFFSEKYYFTTTFSKLTNISSPIVQLFCP